MKKFFKSLGIIILGAISVVVVLNILDGESTNTMNSNTLSGTGSTEPKMAKIGDELVVGDVLFKVNKVSTTKRIQDGPIYYEPDTNDSVFFLVNVTVKNNGKEMINIDSSFFQLTKGDVTYSPAILLTSDDQFFIFEGINPGLTKTGNVVFEVPESEKDFILNVQTGFFGTQQGQIQLY